VSGGRGDVERLPGGDPATESPPAPEHETGGPVGPAGPGRSPRPGPRPRPPVPEPEGTTLRVVLVSRDIMLAAALRSLIEKPGGVRVLDWYSEELDAAIRHTDVVVVDVPAGLHHDVFAVLGGRFLGRTVVLLQEGEHPEALPLGPPRSVLYRPLQIAELWAAVSGVAPEEAEPFGPGEPEPGEGAEAGDPEPVAETPEGQGLPVAESGLLIGLSGRELEPVIGPGQVAPGMDRVTLEQLRRWRQEPSTGAPEKRSTGRSGAPSARAARAEQRRAARTEAREEAARVKAVEAAARAAGREVARRVKAEEAEARVAAREEAGRAKAALEAARKAERAEAEAAKTAARAAGAEVRRVQAQQAKVARAEARETARARRSVRKRRPRRPRRGRPFGRRRGG
jgi:hypothetical protein